MARSVVKVLRGGLVTARFSLFIVLLLPFHSLLAQSFSPDTISEAGGTATVELPAPTLEMWYKFSFSGSTAGLGTDFTFTTSTDDETTTCTITAVDDLSLIHI